MLDFGLKQITMPHAPIGIFANATSNLDMVGVELSNDQKRPMFDDLSILHVHRMLEKDRVMVNDADHQKNTKLRSLDYQGGSSECFALEIQNLPGTKASIWVSKNLISSHVQDVVVG